MATNRRSPLTHSTTSLTSLAKTGIRQGLAITTTLLLTLSSFAEQKPPTPPADSQSPSQDPSPPAQPAPKPSTITVRAGTSIALVLTHPIQSRYIHHGDDIYAQ